MGNYDFGTDLRKAHICEEEAADIFESYGCIIKFLNNDSDFDISVERPDGTIFTVEVKEDFMCKKTGNVAVEVECRGKPSGISVSKADLYLYKIHEPNKEVHWYFYRTDQLKQVLERPDMVFRTVSGGDEGSNTINITTISQPNSCLHQYRKI